MFKAFLLIPQGTAGAAAAQGTWLTWPITNPFVLFQQADRKHLGLRAGERRGPPAPPDTTHHQSEDRGPVQPP